jgi:hypothetical protein
VKRLALALVLLAAPAAAQDRRELPGRNSYANPSAVIAAELAFAQAAQEKGQWTAFAEAAAPDAVMFVPQMVYAQGWLKGRANPPVTVKWQPHKVWASCDGSLMASFGAWQGPKGTGWFTTLWQRQPKGDYKWVLDHGDDLKEPLAAPEMLSGLTADCPPRRERPLGEADRKPGKPPKPAKQLPPLDPAHRSGKSMDGSLSWDVTVAPDSSRHLVVTWRKGGKDEVLLDQKVSAR